MLQGFVNSKIRRCHWRQDPICRFPKLPRHWTCRIFACRHDSGVQLESKGLNFCTDRDTACDVRCWKDRKIQCWGTTRFM